MVKYQALELLKFGLFLLACAISTLGVAGWIQANQDKFYNETPKYYRNVLVIGILLGVIAVLL